MDLIIFGSTSNICKIRVFNNINNISYLFNNIYCYGYEDWSQKDFIKYFQKNIVLKEDNIINKIIFIKGNYNLKDYLTKLKFIKKNTIIYVSTPPICYKDIINFSKNKDIKAIFEKPLALNFSDFITLKKYINNNIFMIDHFLYKKDIINIIEKYKNKEFKYIKFLFHYNDDLEERLKYINHTGFFIDMFQSHFLSILFLLNKNIIKNLLNSSILKFYKKQYNNFGGNKNIDTYFYLELKLNDIILIFESGKKMKIKEKFIIIDNNKFKINDYENEYELFFKDFILNINFKNIILKQELFWKITNYIIENNKNTIIEKY